jgi:hypothetical protein
MAGPNLLGRRADLEVTELRIDSQLSVPEPGDFLKSKNANRITLRSLFTVLYGRVRKLHEK